jgi:hypothetical protein
MVIADLHRLWYALRAQMDLEPGPLVDARAPVGLSASTQHGARHAAFAQHGEAATDERAGKPAAAPGRRTKTLSSQP